MASEAVNKIFSQGNMYTIKLMYAMTHIITDSNTKIYQVGSLCKYCHYLNLYYFIGPSVTF